MRFQIDFHLEEQKIPSDYRRVIISFIKNALTKYNNGEFFDLYYAPGKTKPFAFAPMFSSITFNADAATVPYKRFRLVLSTGELRTAIVLYNSLNLQRGIPFKMPMANAMTLTAIRKLHETVITKDRARFKLLSPLCIREHDHEANTDQYYYIESPGFHKAFSNVITTQLKQAFPQLDEQILTQTSIKPIQCKKTVVKHHSQMIEATIGTVEITGDEVILNHLYLNSLGSKRSAGFGLLENID